MLRLASIPRLRVARRLVATVATVAACALAMVLQLAWPAAHAMHQRLVHHEVHASHAGHAAHAHHDADHDAGGESDGQHDSSRCSTCQAIAAVRGAGGAPSATLNLIVAPVPSEEFRPARLRVIRSTCDLTCASPRGPPAAG